MINWLKKNWIIGLLLIIVVFILIMKYKISNTVNQENNSQESSIQVIPTIIVNPTATVIPDINKQTIGGLTIDQINELKMEEYDIFIDGLSEEEFNLLPPTKYPIWEYVGYELETFNILSFENNQLKVKSKIEDKDKSKKDFEKWLNLLVEPKDFEIIWSE